MWIAILVSGPQSCRIMNDYENDERYQLVATIVIYHHKYLYMFWASICPSSGVQVVCCCIWCSALGVVAVVLRSRCVVLCTVWKFVSVTRRDIYDNKSQLLHQVGTSHHFHIWCTVTHTSNYEWLIKQQTIANCIIDAVCTQSAGGAQVKILFFLHKTCYMWQHVAFCHVFCPT